MKCVTILALTILLSLYGSEAYAYIDPASGAFLLQMVVAAVAGAAVTIKMHWNKLSGWLRRIFSDAEGKDS